MEAYTGKIWIFISNYIEDVDTYLISFRMMINLNEVHKFLWILFKIPSIYSIYISFDIIIYINDNKICISLLILILESG